MPTEARTTFTTVDRYRRLFMCDFDTLCHHTSFHLFFLLLFQFVLSYLISSFRGRSDHYLFFDEFSFCSHVFVSLQQFSPLFDDTILSRNLFLIKVKIYLPSALFSYLADNHFEWSISTRRKIGDYTIHYTIFNSTSIEYLTLSSRDISNSIYFCFFYCNLCQRREVAFCFRVNLLDCDSIKVFLLIVWFSSQAFRPIHSVCFRVGCAFIFCCFVDY